MIQDAGFFDVVSYRGRLKSAIAAAADSGDLSMIDLLLNHKADLHPFDLEEAIQKVLLHGNHAIAMKLLQLGGACLNLDDAHFQLPFSLLDQDVQNLIRTVLVSSCACCDEDYLHIIAKTAAVQGATKVLSDIFAAYPSYPTDPFLDSLPILALKNDHHATFEFILASGRTRPDDLIQCLKFAIKNEDKDLVARLIHLGADPADDEVLESIFDSPHMLEHILNQVPSYPRSIAGHGRNALKALLGRKPIPFAQIRQVLDSGLVSLWKYAYYEEICNDSYGAMIEGQSIIGVLIRELQVANEQDLRAAEPLLEAVNEFDKVITTYEYEECISKTEIRHHHTVLMAAIRKGSLPLVRHFVERGADINKDAILGILRTPLQLACEAGDLEIVEFLLSRGADPNGKPAIPWGGTALQIAAIKGNVNIAALLISHGADMDQPPVRAGGRWPLEGAAENGRIEMIEYLWRVSKTPPSQEICERAIMRAERQGQMACIGLIRDLMEHSAS
ncbi:ankyrin repeat-containing domain protein [Xylariaceae sp. FL0016]|nr:ankyrin repeat-containing domain protein [Xylariaceae sp. FL0016]